MRKRILTIFIFSVMLFFLSGCSGPKSTMRNTFIARTDTLQCYVQAKGSIVATKEKNIQFEIPLRFSKVYKQMGDAVQEGEVIADMDVTYLNIAYENLQAESRDRLIQFNQMNNKAKLVNISTPIAGRIKDIKIKPRDDIQKVLKDSDYVMAVSTKPEMYFTIFISEPDYQPGQNVNVRLEDKELMGTVSKVASNQVTIVLNDDRFAVGALASIDTKEGRIQGELRLSSFYPITWPYGIVERIIVEENESVVLFDRLFQVNKHDDAIYQTLEVMGNINAELEKYSILISAPVLRSTFTGVLKKVPEVEREYYTGEALCTIIQSSDVKAKLSVDEFDIAKLRNGQLATLTFDTNMTKKMNGTITSVSKLASGDNQAWAKFDVLVDLENPQDILLGSNVFAVILVERVDNILIIPLASVYSTNDGVQYVLLDVTEKESNQDSKNKSLPKNAAIIKTGINDGRYVEVVYGLSAGDVILLDSPEMK